MKKNQEISSERNSAGKVQSLEAFAEITRNYVGAFLGSGYSVQVQDVRANNGALRKTLCIRNDGKSSITPHVYLDGCFAEYLYGRTMESICEDILHMYGQGGVHGDIDISFITDFKRVQENICFKLINAERNREFLAGVPHLPFHDLAVVFYVFAEEEGSALTAAVKSQFLDIWGVDVRAVSAAALGNTQRLLRGSVKCVTETLEETCGGQPDGDSGMDGPFTVPLYIATNSRNLNGAAVILYPGLLERFADRHGSFYILPASIHEALFLPCSAGFGTGEIRELVCSVNQDEVQPEDFLSDNVYIYDKEKGRVETV